MNRMVDVTERHYLIDTIDKLYDKKLSLSLLMGHEY